MALPQVFYFGLLILLCGTAACAMPPNPNARRRPGRVANRGDVTTPLSAEGPALSGWQTARTRILTPARVFSEADQQASCFHITYWTAPASNLTFSQIFPGVNDNVQLTATAPNVACLPSRRALVLEPKPWLRRTPTQPESLSSMS